MLQLTAFVCLGLLAKPSYGRPSTKFPPIDTGVVIPLFKRTSALDMQTSHSMQAGNSVVNLTIIEQHLAQVEAKYQQGLSNWQANTGSFSLFAKSSHNYDYEADAPNEQEQERPQTTSEDFPTPYPESNDVLPTSSPVFHSSDVKLPDVRKFHYLPSTAVLTKHRQVFKARQSEPLINEKNDQLWVGYISIGANQQSFLIDFDT